VKSKQKQAVGNARTKARTFDSKQKQRTSKNKSGKRNQRDEPSGLTVVRLSLFSCHIPRFTITWFDAERKKNGRKSDFSNSQRGHTKDDYETDHFP